MLANDPVRAYETTKAEAEAMGAIAFFGDKYGDIVRVLEAGRNSLELCGGTHVRATGDIGPIKIVSEGSIGSNLRRIEAVTGTNSVALLQRDERELARAAQLLGTSADAIVEGIEKRLDENKALRDEIKALRAKAASGRAGELAAEAVDGVVVARVDGLPTGELRDLALAVRQQGSVRAVVLAGANRHRWRRARRGGDADERPRRRRADQATPPPPSRVVAVAARATSPWPAARIRRASTRR